MPVELIGILHYTNHSEVFPRPYTELDYAFVRDCARAHEEAGFDRVLIANSAQRPDSIPIAAYVAAVTQRLKFMIAHRPGFVAPTMAARMLATIDQLSGGRCGVHIITGGDEADQRRDGDFLEKERRYDRSLEYVQVMRKMWTSEQPFDHHGDYYRFEQAFELVKPVQPDGVTVFWGGFSGKAVETGAQVADVYAMPGFDLETIRSQVQAVRAKAADYGRDPAFLISIRVIVADTDEQAWERADFLQRTMVDTMEREGRLPREPGESVEAAKQRAIDTANAGALENRVWRGLTNLPSGRPSLHCLVGGRRELLDLLLGYYEAGVTSFILSGHEPIPDTYRIGQGLFADFRAAVAQREGAA